MGPRAPRSSRPSSPRAAHEGSKLIFGSSSRSRVSIARASHQRPRSLQTRAARREAPKLPGSQAPGGLRVTRTALRCDSTGASPAFDGGWCLPRPGGVPQKFAMMSWCPTKISHRTASPAGGSPGHGSRLPNGRGRAGQAHQRGWAMAGGTRWFTDPYQSQRSKSPDSPAAANEGASLLQAPVSSRRL